MELLIRTAHKQPIVSMDHVRASQRGDLVAACPNGWQWSKAEREHPDWIIVTCELTDIEVQALLESARPGEPEWRRRLGINPDGLVSGMVLSRDDLQSRIF